MKREFIETRQFQKAWLTIGLDDETLKSLEAYIMLYPENGMLIRDTGGLRKLRWPILGRGKSSSIRVIYVDFPFYEKVYLITAYSKVKKETLTTKEKRILKNLVSCLKKELKGSD